MTEVQRFAAALVDAGLLIPTSADGVLAQGEAFAGLTDALALAVRAAGGPMERMRFGAVMPRRDLERLGYFRSFPQLLGSVHCFCGGEAQHRHLLADGEWSAGMAASDLVLIPAACYPLYAILARRGTVPDEGHGVEVQANCFRREPSRDPARLQSFHMQEFVRVGEPSQVQTFRELWLSRGPDLLQSWGLEGRIVTASDPFFGRAAAVLSKAQHEQALKFELQLTISDREAPTACMSFNYHLDAFGRALDLRLADGGVAHTACVGFGVERIALALLRRHGLRVPEWPAKVRGALGI